MDFDKYTIICECRLVRESKTAQTSRGRRLCSVGTRKCDEQAKTSSRLVRESKTAELCSAASSWVFGPFLYREHYTSPSLSAFTAACVRSSTTSFWIMLHTCALAVCSEIVRSLAISLLDFPSTTSFKTSYSR